MTRIPSLLLLSGLPVLLDFSLIADHSQGQSEPPAIQLAPADWPWWRGPNRNGIAAANQDLPLTWSSTEHVLWNSPVPGRGYGSPTVVGDQVFLTTADEEREIQSVLCYQRHTGKELWQTVVHRGGFTKKGNSKNSQASASVACDGQRLFVCFLNQGAVYTTALARNGQRLWQTKVTDFVIHQGFGSSPAVYESLVIVSADNKGGGAVVALDRATGREVWRRDRPKLPNYTSPVLLNAAGRDQLLLVGCDLITSLDPQSGKQLWEFPGATTECVTSAVTDGERVFVSGGYPRNHVAAVRADGSGTIAWQNNSRAYVPSMVVHERHLYAVLDNGFAVCWASDTGKERWRGRLGGTFSASLVLVEEHLFATSEAGKTFIFKATPAAFEVVGVNQLGDEVLSTPTICGNHIYMRVATYEHGVRRELLYCLAK